MVMAFLYSSFGDSFFLSVAVGWMWLWFCALLSSWRFGLLEGKIREIRFGFYVFAGVKFD